MSRTGRPAPGAARLRRYFSTHWFQKEGQEEIGILSPISSLRLSESPKNSPTLTIGTVFPAIIGVLIAAVFVRVATHPLTVHGMRGARAGALAVFVWASARLLRPQILKHRSRGAVVAAAILVLLVVWSIPPVIALLLGTGIGAGLLRSES